MIFGEPLAAPELAHAQRRLDGAGGVDAHAEGARHRPGVREGAEAEAEAKRLADEALAKAMAERQRADEEAQKKAAAEAKEKSEASAKQIAEAESKARAEAEAAKYAGARIEALHFAWAGGIGKGAPHYYRITGPRLLAEYDNAQNRANHVHTVWRDPAGDFGFDVLGAHLHHDH